MNKEKLIKEYQDIQKRMVDYPSGSSHFVVEHEHKLTVSDNDTVTEIMEYSQYKDKVTVLNMASPNRPGGGVENGAVAQEEDLFRKSNLCYSISDKYYPLNVGDMIYTTGVRFEQDRECKVCDVITSPMFNMNKKNHGYVISYKDDIRNILHKLFRTAIKGGCDVFIVGAWGCGVFKNDPEIMSKLFKEVITEGNYLEYISITFAIKGWDNFKVFKKNLT